MRVLIIYVDLVHKKLISKQYPSVTVARLNQVPIWQSTKKIRFYRDMFWRHAFLAAGKQVFDKISLPVGFVGNILVFNKSDVLEVKFK